MGKLSIKPIHLRPTSDVAGSSAPAGFHCKHETLPPGNCSRHISPACLYNAKPIIRTVYQPTPDRDKFCATVRQCHIRRPLGPTVGISR
jgi:hypothetical protein